MTDRPRMNRHVSSDQLRRGRENVVAIREQHEEDQFNRQLMERIMSNRETGPMGFARVDTSQAQVALDAWGELNAALDAAVDEVEKAFSRERQTASASGLDEADTRRAPVLGNRRGVAG